MKCFFSNIETLTNSYLLPKMIINLSIHEARVPVHLNLRGVA